MPSHHFLPQYHILISALLWRKEALDVVRDRLSKETVLLHFLAPFWDMSKSISPDGDLVRMWAAWVRQDERGQRHFHRLLRPVTLTDVQWW